MGFYLFSLTRIYSIYRRSNHMTDRIHTCPALPLSRVGFRCGPVPARCGPAGPGSITFARQLRSSGPLPLYFCFPDPIWSKTCSDMGSNLVLKSQNLTFPGFGHPKTTSSGSKVTPEATPRCQKLHQRVPTAPHHDPFSRSYHVT